MDTIYVKLGLPKTFSLVTRVKGKEMNRFIKRALAVELYREGKVSLGKAAEIADARNKWEMLNLLDEKKVAIDYSAQDAEKDLKTLRKVLKR